MKSENKFIEILNFKSSIGTNHSQPDVTHIHFKIKIKIKLKPNDKTTMHLR